MSLPDAKGTLIGCLLTHRQQCQQVCLCFPAHSVLLLPFANKRQERWERWSSRGWEGVKWVRKGEAGDGKIRTREGTGLMVLMLRYSIPLLGLDPMVWFHMDLVSYLSATGPDRAVLCCKDFPLEKRTNVPLPR